jgi:hypothetical protein
MRPKEHAAIDFETSFFPKRKIGLKTMGVDQYLHHPEVEIYLCSVHTRDGSFVGHPSEFDWGQISHLDWESHNAGFDRRVWRRLCEIHPELAQHSPKNWHCTANLTSYLGLPRDLKGACDKAFGADVSKDARKVMENKTYRELLNSKEWPEILEYAERDAYWCWRLWEDLSHKWPAVEQRISEMTTQQVLRGLPANREYLDQSISRLERACWEAKKLIPWANGTSEDAAVLSQIAVAEECRKIGITPPRSLAEDNTDCQRWEAEHPDIPWVRSMRRYRKANLLMTKLQAMRNRIRSDGRIDFSQKYCGAHTKRASGDQGFNVQGFQRDPFPCVDLAPGQKAKSLPAEDLVDMRKAVAAMNGGQLIVADLAQIEPRTLAWMVNDHEKIKMINKGISVYQVHAIQTMAYNGPDLKTSDPHTYALCKMRVLGLSYGCGAERFVDYCWNQYSYHMTPKEAKTQVADFRRKERLIVNFWNKIHAQLESSIGGDLEVELPSWNSMIYRDVRKVKGQLTATLATGRVNRMWGSLGVENIIQATARDCFYEKLLKIEDAGIPTLFAVHDEVITDEVPADQAEDAFECVQEIMREECEWMPGIALDSEAKITPCYLK